jgi:hypothetical protein
MLSEKESVPLLHGDGVTDDTEAVASYLVRGVPLPEADYRINADLLRSLLPPDFGTGFNVR